MSSNNPNDNSNNEIDMEAQTVYTNALRNIFERIMINNDSFINSNLIMPTRPMHDDTHRILRRRPNLRRHPYFPNITQNRDMRNLLFQTLNQKNKYKKVLSDRGSSQLEKVKFASTMKNDKCPILLEKFKVGEEVTILPCEHVFTTEAITEWLVTEQAKCPVCRFELDSKEVKIQSTLPALVEEAEEDSDTDDDMPPLEPGSEDISTNRYPSDSDMLGFIETLLQLRPPRRRGRNTNFPIFYNEEINEYEDDRDIQAAILASINETITDEDDID